VRKSIATAVVVIATGAMLISGTSEANASTVQSRALSIAASKKGAPYQWGAKGPSRFDCSGLTWYAFKGAGKTLPRTAQQQYNALHHVSPSNRKPGDLVFIGRSGGSIYHVGIYAGWKNGKGWMWNANTGSYRGRKVVLAPVREYTAGSPRAYYGRV
jgi:cell wall-associated NlpC family hydrolase